MTVKNILMQKGLSKCEAEVAELVIKGLSNKEAANALFVTEKTITFHLTNIYKKVGVKSRVKFILWFLPNIGFIENNHENKTFKQSDIPRLVCGNKQFLRF